mgnify:CR=1 FL=1
MPLPPRNRGKQCDHVPLIKGCVQACKKMDVPACNHILCGIVFLCRNIVTTVNTTVNTASEAISISTGK